MNWRNTTHRYGALSVGLHWLMLILIALAYASIELRENFPKGSDIRESLKAWHFMLGLSVLVLVTLRAAMHFLGALPQTQPDPPQWQVLMGKIMHVALYAFMIGMPLLGWLTLSADGQAVTLFGAALPPLTGEDKGTADWAKELHEAGGTIGYVLIGLHTAAALFHHYIIQDNTLQRMLPSAE